MIVTPFLVIKYPRSIFSLRTFREFLFYFKSFLHGLSPPCMFFPPFLICKTVRGTPLKRYKGDPEPVIRAVERLNNLGIEHRELRHPESHVFIENGRVIFIDFDRARISKKPRDVNKIREWFRSRSH